MIAAIEWVEVREVDEYTHLTSRCRADFAQSVLPAFRNEFRRVILAFAGADCLVMLLLMLRRPPLLSRAGIMAARCRH